MYHEMKGTRLEKTTALIPEDVIQRDKTKRDEEFINSMSRQEEETKGSHSRECYSRQRQPGEGGAASYCGRAFRIALTSSATAVRANSNWSCGEEKSEGKCVSRMSFRWWWVKEMATLPLSLSKDLNSFPESLPHRFKEHFILKQWKS